MHPFEIAEHGLYERTIQYLKPSEIFLTKESITDFVKIRKRLRHFKKARKYTKGIRKRNKKLIKKLRKFLFPNALNPANMLT